MPSKRNKSFTGNRTAAIGLIVVCIVGTAILIAARTSEPAGTATATASGASATTAARTTSPARTAQPAAVPTATPQAGEAANGAPAEPVTIVGCLVQDDETFKLKSTSGDDAPRGRSWKSGFLKKSSKTIELVDARRRLNLAGHVGERVSVTGMLDDRELRGTSLKRVAEACD